jgi:hypothetical protein
MADISEFYGSVYTHSIPWALHGKTYAKANQHSGTLLGNRLDRLVRNMQGKQTNGIPIGPDTSFLVAETILTCVDDELLSKTHPVGGFRFFDDYELVFSDLSSAENALATLHNAVAKYNLRLNVNKTHIDALPLPLDISWRHRLRSFDLRTDVAHSLLGYFDEVFALKRMHPADAVVAYSVSRLESVALDDAAWELALELLQQALVAEPGCIQQVATLAARRHAEHKDARVMLLKDALDSFMLLHSAQHHDSEVAWALWLAIAFAVPVSDETARMISTMRDSCVALLALDARARGLAPGLDETTWAAVMSESELYGEMWLLAYEANVRQWLPSKGNVDFVAGDTSFAHLKNNNVRFYKPVRRPTRRVAKSLPDWRSDYDESDDEEWGADE